MKKTPTTPTFTRCPRCGGSGTIVHPAFSVWTAADIDEDPDTFHDMRDGKWDLVCPCCRGARAVTDADRDDYYRQIEDERLARRESGDPSYWPL